MRSKFTRSQAPYEPRLTKEHNKFAGYGWFHVPAWNITIAAPPKAGSSSLKQFMWMHEIECSYIPHHAVKGDVYFVVRHPVDRFSSLWRSKCRDKESIANKKVHGMSPDELRNHIVAGNRDVHWTPQTKLLGGLNATLIPLEDLNGWWAERGYGELTAYNTTKGAMPHSEELHEWICDWYAEDVKLYEKAKS